MPVRPLFLCAWVWWLQLTALQSERVPLLGVRQYSEPPASGLEWIVFSVVLFCKRVQQLLTTQHELPVGPGKRKSRRHVEDGSTTKAKGWNSFRGRSQSEQQCPAFYWLPRDSLKSHWLKGSFWVLQSSKRFCLVNSFWLVTMTALEKESCLDILLSPHCRVV